MSNEGGGGCGCTIGCLGIIVLWLVFWLIAFGLPTPWGTFNLDLFPPKIWKVPA